MLGRRASVAVWIALMIPVLTMALSLGVEVASWEATKVSLQRTADVSATAGALNYQNTLNAQTAATAAARMAQLNGASGTASPGWSTTCSGTCTSPCAGTLTDNQITVKVKSCSGLVTDSDTMVQVTVQEPIGAWVSQFFDATTTYTLSASATSELVSSAAPPTGAGAIQPCLLALSTSGQINGAGSSDFTMPDCTMVSNGTISFSGAGTLDTAGFFAGATISIPAWFTISGTQYPNSGTIPDPYANYTVLQNALTAAAGLTGVTNIACGSVNGVNGTAGQYTGNNNCNGSNVLPNGGRCVTGSNNTITCTMYPGNYGSWVISAGGPFVFNLQPGLYLFNGPITLTQSATVNGSAVTLITAGSFSVTGTVNWTVSAPTIAQAASVTPTSVPGVAVATKTTTAVTVSGAAAFDIEGLLYFPNAQFNTSGLSNVGASCLVIVASSIITTGNQSYNGNCGSLGLPAFTSVAGSSSVAAQVVQ